jgi:hypothetical protein
LETVPSEAFVTQMLASSNTAATGLVPGLNVPRGVPSRALSFVIVLSSMFVTQMFARSNAIPCGCLPTR